MGKLKVINSSEKFCLISMFHSLLSMFDQGQLATRLSSKDTHY